MQDTYKVVIENEAASDPEKLTLQLKREMMAFPRLMGWCRPSRIRKRSPPCYSNSSSNDYTGNDESTEDNVVSVYVYMNLYDNMNSDCDQYE
jgi:hypothetical protein